MNRIGKYEIKQLVARGGMGELYLARDPDLDREVAVKVMSYDIMKDEQARARFYREAKAAARLQHRNIVTVYDFAHDGDIPYIVMEFLRGQNLADRLRKGPTLTLQAKLDVGIQLCEGLHFAHSEGIIHRDVKPANIWLLSDGGVKLLDFGIAKWAAGTFSPGSTVVGSAAYMSPEQIEGQPVDARSDVFSVGAVLFELIAGQRAFDGHSVTAVMMKITQEEPVVDVRTIAPDTPASLSSIIARALEKSPDTRYLDASEMAVDLRLARLELVEVEAKASAGEANRLQPPPSDQDEKEWTDTFTSEETKGADQRPPRHHGEDVIAQSSSRRSPEFAQTVVDHSPDVFRRPEEIEHRHVPVAHGHPESARARRWALVVAAVFGIAAMVAVAIVFGPGLLSRTSMPPRLQITSSPDRARILLDDVDTGRQTPSELQLERLPAQIRLELAGYEPFVTRITQEQFGDDATSSINTALVELLPPAPPPPEPTKVETPPPPVLAQLRVLRPPGQYVSCPAVIGGGWKGYPFDGLTNIRLPAQSYSIRIECEAEPPVEGTIQVPPGRTDRNFSDVVTLRQ